jgi:hypothetical protein
MRSEILGIVCQVSKEILDSANLHWTIFDNGICTECLMKKSSVSSPFLPIWHHHQGKIPPHSAITYQLMEKRERK